MKTPYIPHIFGANALAKVQGRFGWLTVGVASSIAWPEDDVWIEYDGVEYPKPQSHSWFRTGPYIALIG